MANYSADVRIGVVGQSKLKTLQKDLDKVNASVTKLNKALVLKTRAQTIKLNTKGANTAIKQLEDRINKLGRTITVNVRTNEQKGSGGSKGGGGGVFVSNNSPAQQLAIAKAAQPIAKALTNEAQDLLDAEQARNKAIGETVELREKVNSQLKKQADLGKKINTVENSTSEQARTANMNRLFGGNVSKKGNPLSPKQSLALAKQETDRLTGSINRASNAYKNSLPAVTATSKAYQQVAGSAKRAAEGELKAADAATKSAASRKKFGKGFGAGFGTAAASSLGNIPVLGEAATGGLVANFTGGSVAAGALGGAIVGVGAALVAVTADVTTFNNALRLQQKALANTVETSEELEAAFAAINGVSQDFVVPIGEATAQFTKLNAAARASGFGVKEVEEVYRGLAAANVALGGDSERLQGILLATQQVFSKGKVQAEELRGQIGERLAGAFAKFAKSAGLSTSQLDKALEKGEVSLEDFVRFSKSLLEEYEEDAKTLADAPENAAARLSQAMDGLKAAMGPILTDIGNFFIGLANTVVEQLTRMFNALNSFRIKAAQGMQDRSGDAIQETVKQIDKANQNRGNGFGQTSDREFNLLTDRLATQSKQYLDATKELQRLQLQIDPAKLDPTGSKLPPKEIRTTDSGGSGGGKSKTQQYKSQAAQLLIQKQYLEDILKLEGMTAIGTSRQMEDQQFLLRALAIELELKRDLAEIELEKLDAVDKQLKIDNRLLEAQTERKILDRDELQAAFDRTVAFEDQVKELENAIALESAVTDEMKRQAELKIAMAEIEGQKLNPKREAELKRLTENLFQVRADNADPLNQYFNQLTQKVGDTRGQIAQLAQTIETELGSAISNSITGLIDGTSTVQEAFADMFKNIGKAFIDMATQMIAKALVMKAVGAVTSMFGSGGGGWNNPSDFNSIIQLPNYSGGGSTGNAPRSGGIDGRGGFPAILHPQETVIDHTGAMSRYSGGNASTALAMAPMTANVTYSGPTLNFEGDKYIPRSEANALVAAGAKQGQARAMNTLKNSRSQRAKLGM